MYTYKKYSHCLINDFKMRLRLQDVNIWKCRCWTYFDVWISILRTIRHVERSTHSIAEFPVYFYIKIWPHWSVAHISRLVELSPCNEVLPRAKNVCNRMYTLQKTIVQKLNLIILALQLLLNNYQDAKSLNLVLIKYKQ